jgi:hypothetical protein
LAVGRAVGRAVGLAVGLAIIPAGGRKVDLAAFTARTPKGLRYDNSLAKEFGSSSSPDYDTFEVNTATSRSSRARAPTTWPG